MEPRLISRVIVERFLPCVALHFTTGHIKKSHQNISGGIFGGEPINFDLFLTFYNN